MFLRRGRKPEVKTCHSWCSLYVCSLHNLVLSIKMTTVQSIHWRQSARELALFFFRLLFAFPERHCPSSLVTVKKTTFSYFLIFASTFSWNFQVWRSTFITWSSEGAATQNHLEIGDEITNIGSSSNSSRFTRSRWQRKKKSEITHAGHSWRIVELSFW